ncbi:LacI family DNA-binding transcriptional regulator [Planctobacterium marinum]|uniref:LacI family DNA-binding transcriptional regulator n=1 Tax=Planctobacterium marinum TaxID=1631968 RepID=UPI001E3DA88A|nr:LacI family DNA-binding transcriptional regulator [Planctobacterium marinum]MCC2607583.1 LacI family DNA-binding transcriptional regulator [Planctobacterium marinum]
MTKKASTLTDVARIAGVSESTVSRALNDSHLVSEKTRKRIKQIAADMGFKINTLARNLRTQKSYTIAVVLVVSSEEDQSASDPFLLSLVGVIADELSKRNYDLLLSSHPGKSLEKVPELVSQKKADGVILFGQGDDIAHFTEVVKPELPAIVWGQVAPDSGYVTVGTDNYQGGLLATQHLLQTGRKNICFAGHLSYETAQRYQGYQQAIRDAGKQYSHHLDVHFSFSDAYAITQSLLQDEQFHYDAIVAASDTIALGMMKALSEAGKHIPQDVAFVGYDDISVSTYTTPSLSTIRQDTRKGGEKLVELLFERLEGKSAESFLLDTQLIKRSSS